MEGKTIYVRLKSGSNYSGKITNIEIKSPLTWITLIEHKEGKEIVFCTSEIKQLEEK